MTDLRNAFRNLHIRWKERYHMDERGVNGRKIFN
jgi:hypothetical protein